MSMLSLFLNPPPPPPPPPGPEEMNTDGSFLTETRSTSVGGLLRNDQGEWEAGFMEQIWCNSMEEAETGALLKGLEVAKDLGVTKLIVEVDSLVVYNRINGLEDAVVEHANVIQAC